MNFSYKEFVPVYNDGTLDKSLAMQHCVDGFQVINSNKPMDDGQLERLAKILQRHMVYSNIVWKENHRKKENALLDNVDIIILDIDEGFQIKDVIENTPFKIMTLTTTSHTEEHHKFRVFIPLNQSVSFKDNTEYKEFLKVINSKYFQNKADKNCLESGRAYITTDRAEYQINSVHDLLDPAKMLEEAKINVFTARLKSEQLFQDVRTKRYMVEDVKNFKRTKEIAATFKAGNHHLPVYQIIGVGKTSGLTDAECAELIMSYNLGKEYSDFQSLVKKAQLYNR